MVAIYQGRFFLMAGKVMLWLGAVTDSRSSAQLEPASESSEFEFTGIMVN